MPLVIRDNKLLIGSDGGERFKRLAKWIGIPCGCTTREERWNRLYPYEQRPD